MSAYFKDKTLPVKRASLLRKKVLFYWFLIETSITMTNLIKIIFAKFAIYRSKLVRFAQLSQLEHKVSIS
jgi:hypothetical protein